MLNYQTWFDLKNLRKNYKNGQNGLLMDKNIILLIFLLAVEDSLKDLCNQDTLMDLLMLSGSFLWYRLLGSVWLANGRKQRKMHERKLFCLIFKNR